MCTNAARQCGHITKQRGAAGWGGGRTGTGAKGVWFPGMPLYKTTSGKSSLNLSVLNYLGFNDIKL